MNFEQLKNELITLGFTEEKFNQLLNLAAKEAVSTALTELESNADDATLAELARTMESQPTESKDAENRLNMLFEKAYGVNFEDKKQELIESYLKQVIENTKNTKDLYAKYQAGDPTAVAMVKAQESNPDVQKIVGMVSSI
jgi:hypothetical protein